MRSCLILLAIAVTVASLALFSLGPKDPGAERAGAAIRQAGSAITAAPNPCIIPPNGTGCVSTISWVTTNVETPYVVVLVRGALFACVGANTAVRKDTGPWIDYNAKAFELRPATACRPEAAQAPLAAITVRGEHAAASATMKAIPCTISPGERACAANISWEARDTGWTQIRMEGNVFACTPEGAHSAMTGPWITERPVTFTLHSTRGNGCGRNAKVGPTLATATVAGRKEAIKGVYFNPETYTRWGAPAGNSWFQHYFTPDIRDQARAEMRAIREKTGATHLVMTASAFSHLSWPAPTEEELDRLAAAIDDANAEGMKVIIAMGHPYIVPRSRIRQGIRPEAVCGHKAGEVVNGWTLYWDIPECPEDNIGLSKQWYASAVSGLERRLQDPAGIAYIQLSGHVGIPFGAEMNMFDDTHPYLQDAQAYIKEMVPYLNSITDIPFSALLLPANLDGPRQRRPESFLKNVLAVVPLEQWDYIDIAWSPNIRIMEIQGMEDALASSPRKIVLSDGKPNLMTNMTQAEVIGHHFSLVEQHNLGGFWYWLYKDVPSSPEQIGLRQHGYAGENVGGWKEAAVEEFAKG